MTKRYGFLMLVIFMLLAAGCANNASGQQLVVQKSAAAARAVPTATAVPAVVTLLPADLQRACPVTQPPDPPFEPPARPVEPFQGRFWYGHDGLYTSLPLDGTWTQLALGEKVFWWSERYPGEEESQTAMTIRARRLDEPGKTFEQSGATNASHPSFPATAMLHGLELPAYGCWEITGEYKGERLSFVVWVPPSAHSE